MPDTRPSESLTPGGEWQSCLAFSQPGCVDSGPLLADRSQILQILRQLALI